MINFNDVVQQQDTWGRNVNTKADSEVQVLDNHDLKSQHQQMIAV